MIANYAANDKTWPGAEECKGDINVFRDAAARDMKSSNNLIKCYK